MKIGDKVYMLDAYLRNPTRGKIVRIWEQDGAITMEDDRGIRHTTNDPRRLIGRDLFAPIVPGEWID